MKILFLPFLQIPTGHHTVADALIRSLQTRISNLKCSKIDFFSYADKLLEKAFRLTYLTWIDHSPQTFVWLYKNFVYPSKSTKHFKWYELKFLDKMKSLLIEEQPDLIVCTQAFPSFLLSRLKQSGLVLPPIINIYTDFFINKLWGINGIEYHFVPDQNLKTHLITKHNVQPQNIFVTGIPIDECFQPRTSYKLSRPYKILITGGSSGLGEIEQLLANLPTNEDYCFYLLCGNNKKLFKEVEGLKIKNLKTLSYIASRDTMNNLYDEVDAIITKSGGVTISEALHKRLPIFVHSALPGQEEINKEYLLEHNLIIPLNLNSNLGHQLASFLESKEKHSEWLSRVNKYLNQIEGPAWQKIMEIIVKEFLKPQKYRDITHITQSTS